MNYTLNLELGGFDDAEKKLDSLLSKVSDLKGPKVNFNDWLSAGGESDGEKAGVKIGEGMNKGIKKSLSLLDFFQKANFKGLNDFWNNALKVGKNGTPKPEWQGPPDLRGSIKGLRDVGGSDLAKVNSLGSIENLSKGVIKGLRETSGKDLAKVFALPDMNDLAPKMDKLKIGVAAIATLFNPFVGARLLSDAIPKGGMAGGKGVTGAIFGAAGAAGYGEIFVIVKVLETAFKLLVGAIKNTVQAYETARQLYAKSLMQGLGLNFTAKRELIANVLGVGEQDVMRFGAAMAYLNPKLEFAASTLAKTAVPLTGVGWEFKILEQNLKALWATIAEGVAPAVKAFLINLNDFLVTLGKTGALEGLAMILGVILQTASNVIGVFELMVNASVLGLKTIADAIALLIVGTINLLAKIPGASALGIHSLDGSGITKDLKASYSAFGNEFKDFFKNMNGAKLNDVPNPISQMKQMVSSDWEKKGLLVGGSLNNYQKDIAKNTREMAVGIKMIVSNMRKSSGGAPSWGMNSNTAQP